MVTDNASTLMALIRRIDEDVQGSLDSITDNDDEIEIVSPDFSADIPLTEEQMQVVMQSVLEIEAINQVLDDDHSYEELFEEVIGQMSRNTTLVTTIRCGAHSIQLIVRDGIKASNLQALILLCKYVSKKMRTQKFKIIAREANIPYKNPSLSTETRWDSDYLMVANKFR